LDGWTIEMSKDDPKRFIYLAVPYNSWFAELRDAVNIASKHAGFALMRADHQFAPSQDVTRELRSAIERASLVIGDLTTANPNVMWELGYAQALGKQVLLVTQDPGTIPFDLKSARAITYQPGSSNSSFLARLSDAIAAVLLPKAAGESTTGIEHRKQVFFSYSHADAEYLDRVLVHLRPVERSGAIDLWSDTKIKAGDRWKEEIRKAVARARVAVLLVSADFLASEFIATDELPPLLAAAEEKGARVIPVVLKPCRFLRDDRLCRFQALNDPKKPVIRMPEADREELYAKLAEVIETEIAL
jgi:nucleoside 2-deoxyribosyltransferase